MPTAVVLVWWPGYDGGGGNMVFVYIVRCNFSDPAREQAWNAWYSGPKIRQMLDLPYFRTCQRFRRVDGAGRDYLALWTVLRPEAMTTSEYRAQWGFSEWTPYITAWSRDLFDGRPAGEDAFAVGHSGALQFISFEGLDAERARIAQAAIAPSHPGMMWLPNAGLDRHTPVIGLKVLSDIGERPPVARGEGVREAIYRPLSDQHKTANAQHE
jgi:hypothetical protein